MKNQTPKVSVCLSVYNSENYLREAIESILNQSFDDFEFLIIDDGSRDSSPEIIRFYAKQDQRIWFHHRENRGIPKTRNEMLKQATGKYIAVMDADDIALPNRLVNQVQFLDQNPHVVAVGGTFNFIDEKGRFLTCLYPPEDNDTIQEKALAGHGSICHPSAMIRREILLKIGGYDESFLVALDLDLWLRLGEIGDLRNLQSPILNFRLHDSSISETQGEKQRNYAHRACKNAWQRRGISREFEAVEPWRPTRDRASRYQFALKYGWWAWNSRQRKTALIYAGKALQIKPWGIKAFKLLYCTLLKPLP